MKTVYIEGWTRLKVDDGGTLEGDLVGKEKIKEGGITNVQVCAIEASCPLEKLGSAYLSDPGPSLTFGHASSAIDRAVELALATLKSTERTRVVITTRGRFIHEDYRTDTIKVKFELGYTIVKNGKDVYEYTAQEKLVCGARYKELAVQKLREDSTSYKYPINLSAFLLIVRGLRWLSAIALDELSTEERNSLNILKGQCYNNLSYFHLSFENYERAVIAATTVLSYDSGNVKALYRRALGNSHLQNYELAEEDLRLVLRSESSNTAARKQLEIVNEKKRSLDDKYAQAMKKFLS